MTAQEHSYFCLACLHEHTPGDYAYKEHKEYAMSEEAAFNDSTKKS